MLAIHDRQRHPSQRYGVQHLRQPSHKRGSTASRSTKRGLEILSTSGTKSGSSSFSASSTGTIYETVEFDIFSETNSPEDELCGSIEEVAPNIESAFLNFSKDKFNECGSVQEVRTAVLVLWEPTSQCSEATTPIPHRYRQLQNTQPSRGRLNTSSSSSRRRLTEAQGSSSSSSQCSADLVNALRDEGFDSVVSVTITEIRDADCSSTESEDCKLGTCCGSCGCSCPVASESLCEEEQYCLGDARPFDPDFCKDFLPSEEYSTCQMTDCENEGGGM